MRTYVLCGVLLAPAPLLAAPQVDGAVGFRRFEQQVKSEIGTLPGERLVEEAELSLALAGTWGWVLLGGDLDVDIGAYAQLDAGSREAARWSGEFDEEGRTTTVGRVGGAFSELWLGPLVRARWEWLFAELGYGAVGMRWDDARADLSAPGGDPDDSSLHTSPTIAWMSMLGVRLPLDDSWSAVMRVRYRIRYYVERASGPLAADVAHGTQDLTPFFGLTWAPGRPGSPAP